MSVPGQEKGDDENRTRDRDTALTALKALKVVKLLGKPAAFLEKSWRDQFQKNIRLAFLGETRAGPPRPHTDIVPSCSDTLMESDILRLAL